MPQRPDSLETALLLIELLRRIPRRGQVTASQLHAQLQSAGFRRSLRTIQRLLDQASARAQFGLERNDAGKPYGYRWRAGAHGLALARLSAHEALLLRLAHAQLKPLLPAPLMQEMEGFFAQAHRPDDTRPGHEDLARQWPHKVRMVSATQPLCPPAIRPGVLEAVSQALYANHLLDVDYENLDGKRAPRRLMPLGLAQQAEVLYLAACYPPGHGPDEQVRTFALHRMHHAEALPHPFQRPAHFDFDAYIADGQFGYGNGQRIRLSFCITPQAGKPLQETPLSEDQTIRPTADGHWRITATVVQSQMLESWLRGFGDEVWGVRRSQGSPKQKRAIR